METLQLIYPYYENPTMLLEQMRVWTDEWPRELVPHVKIIIVDDGSQKNPAAPIVQECLNVSFQPLPKFELYRVLINIPWNQNGAHNLGFHVADEGWCLTTDIDHVVETHLLQKLLVMTPKVGSYYSFARRQARDRNTVFKRHPNSWLLTRKMFLDSGGYDEDFAGYYGSDSCFRRALTLVGKHVELPDSHYLTVYDEKDIADANTREWGRKDSKYHSARVPSLAKKRGRAYKAENPLRFPWEKQL